MQIQVNESSTIKNELIKQNSTYVGPIQFCATDHFKCTGWNVNFEIFVIEHLTFNKSITRNLRELKFTL